MQSTINVLTNYLLLWLPLTEAFSTKFSCQPGSYYSPHRRPWPGLPVQPTFVKPSNNKSRTRPLICKRCNATFYQYAVANDKGRHGRHRGGHRRILGGVAPLAGTWTPPLHRIDGTFGVIRRCDRFGQNACAIGTSRSSWTAARWAASSHEILIVFLVDDGNR